MEKLVQIKDNLMAIAKNILETEGSLTPVAFLTLVDGSISEPIPLDYSSPKAKRQAMISCGFMARINDCIGIITIQDVAMRAVASEEKEYVEKNYDTECPLAYPPSQRRDGILMIYVDFKDKKNNKSFLYPYIEIEDGYKFSDIEEFTSDGGDLTGNLMDNLMVGYSLPINTIRPNLEKD